nr:hypothetical protein [Tanacetum cinerariifolium]
MSCFLWPVTTTTQKYPFNISLFIKPVQCEHGYSCVVDEPECPIINVKLDTHSLLDEVS